MLLKILFLCKKTPYPEKDGESIAVMNTVKALQRLGASCHLISLNTKKHYVDPIIAKKELTKYFDSVQLISHDSSISLLRAAKGYLIRRPYVVDRFLNKTFQIAIKNIFETIDINIVQLETIFLSPYLDLLKAIQNSSVRDNSNARQIKISLRAHNIESEIWERLAKGEPNIISKIYKEHTARMLEQTERNAMDKLDSIITLSPRDYQWFENAKDHVHETNPKLFNFPIGLDLNQYKKKALIESDIFRICFIGAMDWRPNINGIKWFLDKVWRKLMLTSRPIELHLAGRNMSSNFKLQKIENVFIHGEIDDALMFISQADAMIVPLFEASGMRVKIIEAMALGTPVISTTIGLEGNPAQANRDVLIADSTEEFITGVVNLSSNIGKANELAINARHIVEKNFDINILTKALYEHYKILSQ